MYLPASFRERDRERIFAIIEEHPFATLVVQGEDGLVGNHLPLLLARDRGEHGTLIGHMARANPQWKAFARGGEVLAIFTGPHAYVSPSFYVDPLNVPTWNYVAVHAAGTARVFHEERELRPVLEQLVDTFERREPTPWRLDVPDDFLAELSKAIVGFEIPIARLEGKLKLSQNRAPADARGALAGLAAREDTESRAVAAWMRRIGVGIGE